MLPGKRVRRARKKRSRFPIGKIIPFFLLLLLLLFSMAAAGYVIFLHAVPGHAVESGG